MYTLYLAGLLCVAASVYLGRQAYRRSYYPLEDWLAHSFLSSIGILALACAVATLGGMFLPHKEQIQGPYTLATLKSGESYSGTYSGTFIWATGRFGSTPVYNVLVRNSDGSFTPWSIPADKHVRIVEDNGLNEIGYWRQTIRVVDRSHFLSNWFFSLDAFKVTVQELRVPKGTIKHSFSFN